MKQILLNEKNIETFIHTYIRTHTVNLSDFNKTNAIMQTKNKQNNKKVKKWKGVSHSSFLFYFVFLGFYDYFAIKYYVWELKIPWDKIKLFFQIVNFRKWKLYWIFSIKRIIVMVNIP